MIAYKKTDRALGRARRCGLIQFDSDTYRASYAGESVQLLPKEFALFRYLYENAGRSFSREQLLDAVWPLESPSDRTVDDHVYRLRGKLAGWAHLLRVETIRGQGYKLVRQSPKLPASPLLQDEQFADDVKRMLSTYQRLGMGAAMRLLSANRDVLGLPGDPYYDAYLRFVAGDFEWLLGTDGIDRQLQAVYAVFIHAAVQSDPAASLSRFERLIAQGRMLPRDWLSDLRLGAIGLYLEAEMPEKARAELDAVRQDVAGLDSPSFSAVFLLREVYLLLREDRPDEAADRLRECEELLARHPMQRERGAFLATQAIFRYRQGDIRSARQALDEAIETIGQTHFIPHLLALLNMTLSYLRKESCDEAYRLKVQRQWDRLAAQYRFDELAPRAERLLERLL